jgi:phage baseplate assembly protein W
MEFNFKNTGQSVIEAFEDTKSNKEISLQKPFGIMTPLRHSIEREGIFEMNYDLGDQLADNLRNLVQTNYGERLGHFDFGANLRPLSLEVLGQEKFEVEAMSRIGRSVSKYLPFIQLKTMTVLKERETKHSLPQVVIQIQYTVPRADSKTRAIDVIINLAG